MGGRGASSGISDSGKRYGTEYKTIAQFGNVKVVRANDGGAKAPMETMTPGRVYATVDKFNDIKYITFHDAEGERVKQIDVKGIMEHCHTLITDMNMTNMEHIQDCLGKTKS